jgi:hypothetical protein
MLPLFGGCGDVLEETEPVQLTLNFSSVFSKSAEFPIKSIGSVVLEVTGQGMEPISLSKPIPFDNGTVTLELNVPIGTQRQFVVAVFDANKEISLQGEAVSDVRLGEPLGIQILLRHVRPIITLSVASNSISERLGTTTTTITARSGIPVNQDVTITLLTSGTATDVTDFTLPLTIIIPAGNLSALVTLSSVFDLVKEGDETVVIDINTVINGTESGAQRQVVTIKDTN